MKFFNIALGIGQFLILMAILNFVFIDFNRVSSEIKREGGLSGIIAKGIDAMEDFKEDVNNRRKR